MRKIAFSEFFPPIVFRALRYFKRRLMAARKEQVRSSPFDNLPINFDAKWVLDIGANVGDVAVAALNSYKDSRVICFEPVQKTHDVLKNRLAPFGDRVQMHKFALSNAAGVGEINITTFHGANSIAPQADFHKECNPHVQEVGKERIELVRLDDYSANFPCEHIDIMKIDVEGHELNVLKGVEKVIKKNKCIIQVEAFKNNYQSVNNFLILAGYKKVYEVVGRSNFFYKNFI